ncbi:MAG: DUF3060 domain-containing protein [Myxococcaceae bacterium]|nr:DUF3060 domain-containing protein [Myxococcaceae bacterium]
MRLLLVSIITLTSALSLAQQVKVQTGSGQVEVDTGQAGVQVNTGPGGVRVEAGNTSVKTGTRAANVNVKTGQGTTTVQVGGQAVRVENTPAATVVVTPPPAPVAPPPPVAPEVVGEDEDDLVIQENGQTIEHTCGNDQLVIVNGDQNVLSLHGPCKDLHVNGARNRITADSVQSIVANGDANQIHWRAGRQGKNPRVSSNGNKNTVAKLR